MDDRLQLLVSDGADVTIKLTKASSFVQIRKNNDVFKGTGGNLTKAIDRALDAYNGKTKSIRGERKKKEIQRERQLDKAYGNMSTQEIEFFSQEGPE